MIVGDERVTTWLSKLALIDKQDIDSLTSVETSDYFILCIRPDERALLSICLTHYFDWRSRWYNFADETERLDLIGRTYHSLGVEMACSEDVQLLIDYMAANALTLTEIRDRLAPGGVSIEERLSDLNDKIDTLNAAVAALDPGLFNDLEDGLSEISKILGGAAIGILP